MMLSMFVNDRRDNWNELLPFVMHAYRTSVHESTGNSPFRLMMGEECSLTDKMSRRTSYTQSDLVKFFLGGGGVTVTRGV